MFQRGIWFLFQPVASVHTVQSNNSLMLLAKLTCSDDAHGNSIEKTFRVREGMYGRACSTCRKRNSAESASKSLSSLPRSFFQMRVGDERNDQRKGLGSTCARHASQYSCCGCGSDSEL
ncbi:hypothetical protein DFJ77DRAFT_62043 [Powellomyces hirtus]|nr:hypothetical protein DFJ77DRAFT_62043 [Powellomyces hirtus]